MRLLKEDWVNAGGWIVTHTGLRFDFTDPQPDQICIEDIAHALSLICRFGGHSKHHYSVAQHSWLLSYNVPDGLELEALLHDGAEAYTGDIPSPLKAILPDFQFIESNVNLALRRKFNLMPVSGEWPCDMHPDVKAADKRILVDEAEALFENHGPLFDSAIEGMGLRIAEYHPADVEEKFLHRYRELTG